MFTRLFAQSGLSLDRLRALVEVGASGGIVRAAEGDPGRQSQYSRQLKELEGFFQSALVERHGKGVRLTAQGKELARISRFFLLGLSNFQRGCLAEGQRYRIGGSATFVSLFVLPLLVRPAGPSARVRFTVETVTEAEIERRLHDLTLDFGVVPQRMLSRPLQVKELGTWQLRLWVPKTLCRNEAQAERAFTSGELPLALATNELPFGLVATLPVREPDLTCSTFLEARTVLAEQGLATLLPDYVDPGEVARRCLSPRVPALDTQHYRHSLAWNPRLLRLNPHAARQQAKLVASLKDILVRVRRQTRA